MELLTIKMLNTAVERRMNRALSALGLTYTQTTVIAYLRENHGKDVCQKDIERSLGLTHPTVSSVLRRMEANGLISAETLAADRRYRRILLTSQAEQLSQQIDAVYRAAKKELFSGVSPAQRELISGVMRQMLENAKNEP